MAGLILPDVLVRQPLQALPIDYSKSLAQGLLSVRNGALIPYTLAGQHGRAMARVGSSGYINTDIQQNTNSTNGTLTGRDRLAFVALVRRTNSNSSNTQFASRYRDPGNTNSTQFGLGVSPFTNNGQIRFVTPGGSVMYTHTNASATPDTLFLVGTWDRIAQVINLYLNGVLVATNSIASTSPPTGGYTLYDCDADSSSANTGFGAYVTMLYERIPSAEDVRRLAANPWQVLRAPSRSILVAPAVTTAIAPGTATLMLGGLAPAIDQSAHQFLAPQPASLAFTGLAPQVFQSATTSLQPGPGQLALSGLVPDVEQSNHQLVMPDPAILGLDGQPLLIQQTSHTTLDVPGTDPALTGLAPSVLQVPIPADARYARPIGDVAAGDWLASDGGYLANAIRQDDGVFMQATAPGACEIKLAPVVDPGTSTGQVVRYKAGSSSGSGLVVRLKQGSTIIASWVHASLPLEDTLFSQALAGQECDAITDYSDLRLEFEAY